MADKHYSGWFLFYPKVVADTRYVCGLPQGTWKQYSIAGSRSLNVFAVKTWWRKFVEGNQWHPMPLLHLQTNSPSPGTASIPALPQDYRDHLEKFVPTLNSFGLVDAAQHFQDWISDALVPAPLLDVSGCFG